MYFRARCCLLIFFLMNNVVAATHLDTLPERILRGKVVDRLGEQLIGARIQVKGDTLFAIADIDGSFALPIPPSARKVTVSSTGIMPLDFRVRRYLRKDSATLVMKGWNCHLGAPYDEHTRGLVDLADLPPLYTTHPYQHLRGHLPGLVITQAGNDPWETPEVRHQGIHSFFQRQRPRWVVAGMPDADPLLVPTLFNFNEVRLLQRPSDLARYGLLAGAGILAMDHHDNLPRRSFGLTYQNQLAFQQPIGLPDVLTATEFRSRRNPVADLGYETDWLREVTRSAFSHAHQLRLEGGYNNGLYWRTQGGFRQVDGVGRGSSFAEYRGQFLLGYRAKADRFGVSLRGNGLLRTGTYDDPATFFYASKYNPTAPVRFDGPPAQDFLRDAYVTSNLRFRNYFEIASAFDYYNPVAIQQVSERKREEATRMALGKIFWKPWRHVQLQMNAGRQVSEGRTTEKNPLRGFYQADILTFGIGRFWFSRPQTAQDYWQVSTSYRRAWDNERTQLHLEGGYGSQHWYVTDEIAEATGFATDDFNRGNFREEVIAIFPGFLAERKIDATNKLRSISARADGRWRWLNLSNTLNYQLFNYLGTAVPARLSWGTNISLNVDKLLFIPETDINVEVGYGQFGGLPTIGEYANGTTNLIHLWRVDPDLQLEKRTLFRIGAKWNTNDFFGSIYRLAHGTEHLIAFNIVQVPFASEQIIQIKNVIETELQNHSTEVTIGYVWGNRFRWRTALNWSYTESRTRSTNQVDESSIFQGYDQLSLARLSDNGVATASILAQDGPLGQIIGEQLDTEASNTSGTIQSIIPFPGAGASSLKDELGTIGNGLPRHSFALINNLMLGSWALTWQFRGELGHDLANIMRGELAPTESPLHRFPAIRNELAPADQLSSNNMTRLSSYHIESGDYLSLDYVSLTKEISSNWRITLSVQHVFLWTRYLGVDPSPHFVDENGGSIFNYAKLAAGIDRRSFYPRARTYSLSVRLSLW
ncbi:MAG: hypothetical protein AAGJ82_02025 [Bacteroidota bacterium]